MQVAFALAGVVIWEGISCAIEAGAEVDIAVFYSVIRIVGWQDSANICVTGLFCKFAEKDLVSQVKGVLSFFGGKIYLVVVVREVLNDISKFPGPFGIKD